MKGQMYSGKSSGFVRSSFFPISILSLSCISVAYVLLALNSISWCFILDDPRHLVNSILPSSQFTSRLCLTSQSCPKNISVPFKSVTIAFKVSLCLLIFISSGAILITFPFLVPSVLNILNEKLTGFVLIFLFLISYSSIPV